MKKLLTVAVMAIIVIGTMGVAQAQEVAGPVGVEVRGNLVKGGDNPIDYYPSYAFVLDVGAPVDLGLAWGTEPGAEERSVELSLPVTLYTHYWGDETNMKSVEFQLYPITKLSEGTSLKDRSLALGVIYDAGLVSGVNTFARGLWHNYEVEGMTEDITDWNFQFGLVFDTEVLK